jgi:carboxypeptidase Taq
MNSYLKLEGIFKKIYNISSAAGILHWDSAVIMPTGSAEVRAEQMATLNILVHELIVDPQVKDLLDSANEQKASLNDWQKANLQRMESRWKHANALDSELVENLSIASSECEVVWRTARAENDFKTFAPHLKKVLSLVREEGARKAEYFNCGIYDALLDSYDPGRKSAEIDTLFADLESFLPGFIQEAIEAQNKLPTTIEPSGRYNIEAQRNLGVKCMEALGFNFNNGRLDVSHHPFCGGVPGDIRITTRYNENEFLTSLMGILHETGHALYENNLPLEWRTQPVGSSLGMSIHESQSLLFEMQICRSIHFLKYVQPLILNAFNVSGDEYKEENLYRIINKVEPSLIRVDADEVTYPAHILLRYKLEKALLSGDLEVEDLPHAWNSEMKRLLNINVPSDKDGCMQDIHWPMGSFGYFPTYTLGAIIAAQWFSEIRNSLTNVEALIEKGEFKPIVEWLQENIYSQGSKYLSNDLIKKVTGKPLDVENYKKHLRRRYVENLI